MRHRNRKWIFTWAMIASVMQLFQCEIVEHRELNTSSESNDSAQITKEHRGLFQPRMDYEQWTPLGRGDPLKNDPTYVYVPPVLERVHYWIDPALRKPDPPLPGDNQKTEILLLGVSSKKSSSANSNTADNRKDTFDPLLKFVDGPKFNSYQRIARPTFNSMPSFFSGTYFMNKNKLPERGSFAGKGSEQRVPYTMLVPPPMPKRPPVEVVTQAPLNIGITSNKPVTLSGSHSQTALNNNKGSTVSIQEANLVYHSSSLSDASEWNNDKNHYITIGESSSVVTWKTPTPKPNLEKNVERLNAIKNGKEKMQPPESYMQFQQVFGNARKNITLMKSEGANNSFKPTLFVLQNDGQISGPGVMIKGEVSDDNLDLESSYVNIGKPEAQVDSSSGLGVSGIAVAPPQIIVQPMMMNVDTPIKSIVGQDSVSGYSSKNHQNPMTLQTLQTMQTLQPPPVSLAMEIKNHSGGTLHALLQNEITEPLKKTKTSFSTITMRPTMTHTKPFTSMLSAPSTLSYSPIFTTTVLDESSKIHTTNLQSSPSSHTPTIAFPGEDYTSTIKSLDLTHTSPLFITTTVQPTTMPPSTTITTAESTSKPYRHEPLKLPMYLIIQGHSKVKTYGPSKQIHGIKIQETNEIPTSEEKDIYQVKHLHNFKKDVSGDLKSSRNGRTGNLQTLSHVIQTGLGAIDFSQVGDVRRMDKDENVQETEVHGSFVVKAETTSEKYYKGIVETARKMKDDQ